jgi:DNA-directed RNA polymerase specialized sigma24 family protein
MGNTTDRRIRWTLTGAALDAFLGRLDEDRDRAAAQYEALRRRLHALLTWWGSRNPNELADMTLDRVSMKLQEGAVVPAASLFPYIRSVARLIYYESLRDEEREERALRDATMPGGAHVTREAPGPPSGDGAEPALRALDGCLDTLASTDRELILDYYSAEGGSNLAGRRRLAMKLGISATALRIRAHRLRERLEACVDAAMANVVKALR